VILKSVNDLQTKKSKHLTYPHQINTPVEHLVVSVSKIIHVQSEL